MKLGALGDHLGGRLGALDGVGLGVGDHRLDLLAQDAALGVEVLDRHHRALERRSVIGVHPAALGDREADHDLVVGRLGRRLQGEGEHRAQDGDCDSRHHHASQVGSSICRSLAPAARRAPPRQLPITPGPM